MTRRELNTALGATLVALVSEAVAAPRAEAAAAQQSSREHAGSNASRPAPNLLHESIGDIGDAEANMLILTIPPSPVANPNDHPTGRFPAHKHPGPVFAYVLEGSVENQVDPDEPKTYKTGDYWYEPAMHVHRLLRNLSDTQQARILVFEVFPKGKPGAVPAQ